MCGASFAGLAVARELAGSGADVLLVDRYEIGERATSACAAPLPWLEAMGVAGAVRQELPYMGFHTPHGSVRYRLPWSWAAFDYAELCRLLFEQCDARFEIAKVSGRRGQAVLTDRGELSAPLVVDALGWRRVLGARRLPAAGGAAVARARGAPRRRRRATWTCGSSARWCATAMAGACRRAGEQRVGVGSYEPRDHVREPTVELARGSTARRSATRATGSLTGCAPRPRTACSSSATRPATASRSRARASARPSTSGSPADASCAACSTVAGRASEALRRYAAFSASHARAYGLALRLQWLVPRLPPRLLTLGLRAFGRGRWVDRAFGWYLDQASPSYAAAPTGPAVAASAGTQSRTPSHSLP